MNKRILKIQDLNFLEFLRTEKIGAALCNEQGDFDIMGSYIDTHAEVVLNKKYLIIKKPKKSDTNEPNDIKNLAGIEMFTNLISITCSCVGLEEFPSFPPNLQTLNVSKNKLKVLPPQPSTLTYLDISGNKGIHLPSLGEGIKKLFCQKCKLKELPKLPASMRYVECQNNSLRELPEMYEGIIDLNCDNNKIKNIEKLPSSLEVLYCSNNKLTKKPKHPNAYIKCKGNKIGKRSKKPVESYFGGEKTDNFLLKLVLVNELIKTDDALLDSINALMDESNVQTEMWIHGLLSKVKTFIKEFVVSKKQLDAITSLTFSRKNKIFYLLDPDMEYNVDDYDLKKWDGISELKHLEMVFFESGLKKNIDLKPLLDLKNVKKIDNDYFSKALYYFKKENSPFTDTSSLSNAYASFGNLSQEVLERSDLADAWGKDSNGVYRIIYTEKSTVIISDGVSEKLDMEFFVEIPGTVPFESIKNNFLIAFLENTIKDAIEMEEFEKKLYSILIWSITSYLENCDTDAILKEHKTNAIESYFTNGYLVDPPHYEETYQNEEEEVKVKEKEEEEEEEEWYGEMEEDNDIAIGALFGIESEYVPKFISVNNKKIGLVNVRPHGVPWINSFPYLWENTQNITRVKSQIFHHLNLVNGNYLTPLDNYSDYNGNADVTQYIIKELNELYSDGALEEVMDRATELLEGGSISYDLLHYKAFVAEKLDSYTTNEAIEAYKACLEKFPDDLYPNLYYSIADLLVKDDKYEEGISYYNLYMNTDASLQERKFTYLDRGKAYAALKNYEAAITDLTITYNYSRGYKNVNLIIPEYYLCNDQLKQAFDFLKHDLYMERNDEILVVLNLLFMITSYLKKNEKEERRAFSRMQKQLGNSNVIYYDLNGLLNRLKRGEEFDQYILEKVADFSFEEKEIDD